MPPGLRATRAALWSAGTPRRIGGRSSLSRKRVATEIRRTSVSGVDGKIDHREHRRPVARIGIRPAHDLRLVKIDEGRQRGGDGHERADPEQVPRARKQHDAAECTSAHRRRVVAGTRRHRGVPAQTRDATLHLRAGRLPCRGGGGALSGLLRNPHRRRVSRRRDREHADCCVRGVRVRAPAGRSGGDRRHERAGHLVLRVRGDRRQLRQGGR